MANERAEREGDCGECLSVEKVKAGIAGEFDVRGRLWDCAEGREMWLGRGMKEGAFTRLSESLYWMI